MSDTIKPFYINIEGMTFEEVEVIYNKINDNVLTGHSSETIDDYSEYYRYIGLDEGGDLMFYRCKRDYGTAILLLPSELDAHLGISDKPSDTPAEDIISTPLVHPKLQALKDDPDLDLHIVMGNNGSVVIDHNEIEYLIKNEEQLNSFIESIYKLQSMENN